MFRMPLTREILVPLPAGSGKAACRRLHSVLGTARPERWSASRPEVREEQRKDSGAEVTGMHGKK